MHAQVSKEVQQTNDDRNFKKSGNWPVSILECKRLQS